MLGQATTLFYPFGSEAGDDNMTYTGGGTDLVTLNLTFGFNWFSDQNNPTMTVWRTFDKNFQYVGTGLRLVAYGNKTTYIDLKTLNIHNSHINQQYGMPLRTIGISSNSKILLIKPNTFS